MTTALALVTSVVLLVALKPTMMIAIRSNATDAAATGVGASGTASFSGTVPEAYSITGADNGVLSGALGNFGTLTIGKGSLVTPTPLQIRIRSNHAYKLTANASITSGLADGTMSTIGGSGQILKTSDIGFGITNVDRSGANVVGGGVAPTRADIITNGFDAGSGWPDVVNGRSPSFSKTLHDIFGIDIQILSGPRISASGDNSSSDNYIVVTVGVTTLPQYFTPSDFNGTVTFTITSN